ncbi:MAG: ThuA domain-containing protein [Planctomycetes bacterium]|nr:ThuA domain-containing protein [Planctomycetota bacterium]
MKMRIFAAALACLAGAFAAGGAGRQGPAAGPAYVFSLFGAERDTVCGTAGLSGRGGWALTSDTAGQAGRATAREEGGGRVLIVADERPQMEVLAGFLRAEGRYETRIADQKDLPADLGVHAAVFMYVHSKFLPEPEKALIRYAAEGGRLVVLHHGMASARAGNPDWLRMAGIRIAPRTDAKHPWRVVGQTTHTLVNLQPRHYITSRGVRYDRTVRYRSSDEPSAEGEFPGLDLPNTEVFLNQQFTDGREKTVLFGSMCTDPQTGETIMQDRGGWYKPAGKGWLFYLQPGHAESDFRNLNYCRIILNCLTWQPPAEQAG